MDLQTAIIIILGLIVVIQNFWIKGMIDPVQLRNFIGSLESPVEKTPNKLDDALLSIAQVLAGLQRDTGTESAPIENAENGV